MFAHKRVGHANVQRLRLMQNHNIVLGLPKFKVHGMQGVCKACQFGKQSKGAFLHDKHVSQNVLDVVHSNVWCLAKIASMGGYRYYVTFIDDHTRKVWVYFMKKKSEVFNHFQSFKVMVQKKKRKYLNFLRSDEGEEYFSKDFSDFLQQHGA